MKLRITLVLLSCALSILMGLVLSRRASSASSDSAPAKLLIGLSMDTLKEERWQGDRDLFVKRAQELGAEVLVQSANGDDIRQLSDVEALISRGVKVLVIIPHNGAAMARAVERAHAAGISVLAYDRLITDCDLDLYLTFDNVKVGELQARAVVDHFATLPPGAPRRLVRLYGSKTDNNALLFKEGQDKVLQPLIANGAIQVVHEDWVQDWKPENAKRIANAALTRVGHEFEAILASNDGTAGGAIQALSEEGLAGRVFVTGQDAELAACQRLVAGLQAMTIYKPLHKLATQAAEYAVALAKGTPIIAKAAVPNGRRDVPAVLLEVIPVSKANLQETVVKDGFHPAAALGG